MCSLFLILVFSGFVGLSNPDNFEAAERAVGQVLLQLRRLVNVWKDVLPSHVYAKSIGMNLNEFSIYSEILTVGFLFNIYMYCMFFSSSEFILNVN